MHTHTHTDTRVREIEYKIILRKLVNLGGVNRYFLKLNCIIYIHYIIKIIKIDTVALVRKRNCVLEKKERKAGRKRRYFHDLDREYFISASP